MFRTFQVHPEVLKINVRSCWLVTAHAATHHTWNRNNEVMVENESSLKVILDLALFWYYAHLAVRANFGTTWEYPIPYSPPLPSRSFFLESYCSSFSQLHYYGWYRCLCLMNEMYVSIWNSLSPVRLSIHLPKTVISCDWLRLCLYGLMYWSLFPRTESGSSICPWSCWMTLGQIMVI